MADLDPLIVDAYADDLNGNINWSAIVNAGKPWCGAVIKCTEGVNYAPGWFVDTWRTLNAIVPAARKGVDWFRGAYCYWLASASPIAQAELYLSMVEAGGGWSTADLWPIIDVENGNNPGVSASQVVDGVSAWAAWILARTGRKPMLYGGSLLRDLGIKSHMGCGLLWTALYGSTLPPAMYESIGWSRDRLWGWQYRGTSGSTPVPTGYPSTTPAGRLDTSIIVIGDAAGPKAPLDFTASRTGALNIVT